MLPTVPSRRRAGNRLDQRDRGKRRREKRRPGKRRLGKRRRDGRARPRVSRSDLSAPSPEEVARFLRDNPDWLAGQAGLYEHLSPPCRVHGDRLADHMAAMLGAARRRVDSATVQLGETLCVLRAGAGVLGQVQEAVLALVRAEDLSAWITVDLPALLGVDAALLCSEPAPGKPNRPPLATRVLAPGSVARLIGRRDVVLRRQPADAAELHGEAAPLARHDALLRVPAGDLPPMLLALAARNDSILGPTMAEGGGLASLGFLGRALAARLEAARPLRAA